jgi:hypothetical protein
LNDNDKNEAAYIVLPESAADAAAETPAEMPAESAANAAAIRFPAMTSAAGPLRKVDGRTRAARAFHRSRRELIQALGGSDHISPQQAVAVRIVAEADALRRSLFADSISGVPVAVADYSALAQVSLRALRLIGMARIAKDAPRLADYLRTLEAEQPATPPAQPAQGEASP